MNKGWERFFYIFSYVSQGSSYLSPRAYAIMHRMHHAFTDTPEDPHSPTYDKNIFSMMWRTKKIYSDIFSGKIIINEKFTRNIPDWKWLDRIGHSRISRIAWIAVYSAFYILCAPSPWFLLLVPVHSIMGPLHGVIINWFAHKYGSENFKVANTSRNLFKLDVMMLGEGYHNNHHKFPSRSNFAAQKGEYDFCYPIIRFLDRCNVIRLINPVEH